MLCGGAGKGSHELGSSVLKGGAVATVVVAALVCVVSSRMWGWICAAASEEATTCQQWISRHSHWNIRYTVVPLLGLTTVPHLVL